MIGATKRRKKEDTVTVTVTATSPINSEALDGDLHLTYSTSSISRDSTVLHGFQALPTLLLLAWRTLDKAN